MAAYQTQQINVGAVQAPDVGGVFTDLADRLSKNYQLGLQNARAGNEMAMNQARFNREQVLNQRQDTEYNRQQNALQASKDIAKELIDTPYAEKFGGKEATAKIDADVKAEAERRMAAGEAPFSAEEAAGIQKTYELNRPYKEDAQKNIIARLMQAGATSQQAAGEAEGLTRGLLSRADEQNYLDQQRKVQQEYNDNAAKANLEALKANIDIGKANQSGDVHKAEIQQRAMQIMYGGGSGGGSGSTGGSSGGGYSGISNTLGTIGWSDAGKAQDAIAGYVKKGYTDAQINRALSQSIDIDPTAKFISDKNVNFDAMDRSLAAMTPGQNPYAVGGIRDVGTGGVNAKDLLAPVAPYVRAGYDPDRMEAALRANAPTVFGGSTASNAVSNQPTGSNANARVALDPSKYPDFNMDRYVAKNIKVESSGNPDAKTGSYQGLMQLNKDEVSRLGYDWNQYLKDPKIQEEAGRVITASNVRQMEKQGLPINDFTVYMAHNQGVRGAQEILSGNPSKDVILNMMNQNIVSNDLPKLSNGQVDIKKIMADPTVTAESLTNKYHPVEKYIEKFGPKFEGTKPELPNSWPSTKTEAEVKGNKLAYADAFSNMSRADKLKVLEKNANKYEKEDWSNPDKNEMTKEDLDYLKEDSKSKVKNTDQKNVIDDITRRYQENNGGLLYDDNVAIMKLQKDGHMTRQEAEKAYRKIVQESVKGPVKNTGTDWNY